WVYRKYQAGQRDPMQVWMGPVYDLLRDKYRIDEIYQALFMRPSAWVATTFVSNWVDRKFLDGILFGISQSGLIFGKFLRQIIDLPIFNRGLETVFGQSPLMFGDGLRRIQTGRIQQYVLFSLMVVLIVTLVVVGISFPVPGR
ncbi:MAG: hypothetical protein LWX83_17340, partial [Anaerolineae bacterium]|nr:hypothetical protein [Anaerolineae bacterium]